MKLEVRNKTSIADYKPTQTINVIYDSSNEATTIIFDVDIVTLGIAANVLMDEYNRYLAELDKELSEEISTTIKKAVSNEKNRSKNTEPISHIGCRKDARSDGTLNTERRKDY